MVIDAESKSQPDAADSAPKTVLVIDDDRAVLDGLSELLENEGYNPVTAQDGRTALERLRRGVRPRVILLDLMMPGMDGWDFRHEQLRDDDLKDIPVVVITATGFSKSSVKTQFGDVELVPKPPRPAALLNAVRRCCGEPTAEPG
jgi:CheY-like chemotaxis protein